MKQGYTYITTNKNHTVLYTGTTSDLFGRNHKHKIGYYPNSFTSRYNATILVYYEVFPNMSMAIAREKQLKAGSRKKKIQLIEKMNPNWEDLALKKRRAPLPASEASALPPSLSSHCEAFAPKQSAHRGRERCIDAGCIAETKQSAQSDE